MMNAIQFMEKLYLCVFNDKKTIRLHFENQTLAPLYITTQDRILDVTVRNKISKKYAPPYSFKKMFLRTFCDVVESYGSEYSEDLLKEYTEMLSKPSEENNSFRSYLINTDCCITLQESDCFVTKSTTGLQTWEASKYLAEWCINNFSLFHDKAILEFGSGIGLLGITVLKFCQPKQYIFTDKSREVLDVLSKNIKINITTSKDNIQQTQLVWATTCESEARNLPSDILLGSDLVYDKSMVESLAYALKTFLSNGPTCAYIASTIRDPETDEKFLYHLGKSGLNYEILKPHQKSLFIYNPTSNFVLYKIRIK